MINIIFLFFTTTLILFQRYREGRWLNLISLLMTPYVLIVFLNNFYFYKFGFYKISDNVLLMLLWAFAAFFIGTLPIKYKVVQHTENKNIAMLQKYDIRKIRWFLYFVGIVGILKAFLLYRQGIFLNEMADDSEGIMGNGIVAHMLLATYSVLPIYFLNWTYNKTIKDLIPVILILIVAFSSLIKYNVIGPIVTLFIFVSLYRSTLLKTASIVMISLVIILFVANYALGFAISDSEVDPFFYLVHFWKYFSGSVIYDNYIFTTGIRVDTSIFYKLMTFVFTLPNMFLNKLFDERLFPHVGQDLRDVSNFGEQSNVVDAIGYLYPSKGDVSDIITFFIVVALTGLLFSYLYKICLERSVSFNTFIANFLTYFVFFSFFSQYATLTNPWEIVIWALIIPHLFYKVKRSSHSFLT